MFKQWLKVRPKQWSDGIDVVVMDGFAGLKTAASEELPDVIELIDPFHVVKRAGVDMLRRPLPAITGQYINWLEVA